MKNDGIWYNIMCRARDGYARPQEKKFSIIPQDPIVIAPVYVWL